MRAPTTLKFRNVSLEDLEFEVNKAPEWLQVVTAQFSLVLWFGKMDQHSLKMSAWRIIHNIPLLCLGWLQSLQWYLCSFPNIGKVPFLLILFYSSILIEIFYFIDLFKEPSFCFSDFLHYFSIFHFADFLPSAYLACFWFSFLISKMRT